MTALESFKTLETELDRIAENLSIWELPFQSVITILLFNIEHVDFKQPGDTTMDYMGRLSYIYPLIKKKAAKAELNSTTNAVLSTQGYIEDINFLNAYAHFSMLMPQVHRGMFSVSAIDDTHFTLQYPDTATENAEIIDRLYGYLSQELVEDFSKDTLNRYLAIKVKSGEWRVMDRDMQLIKAIYDHYRKGFLIVEPLPDVVIAASLGFTYDDYYNFCAAARALADWQICLARAFHNEALQNSDNEELGDKLMAEYFEYSVACYQNVCFKLNMQLSGLDEEVFNQILSFYLIIYKKQAKETLISNAFCGDGYLPPYILMGEYCIYGGHPTKYMLTLNNILYSANNGQKFKKIFDDEVSEHLEPVLINQLTYLFGHLSDLKIVPNVNYSGGEMDILVVSEKEQLAICIQAKATIAPDSGRTVQRVEGSSLEGIAQIKHFESFTEAEQIKIINDAAGTSLTTITRQHLLVVRSCAGSAAIWKHNDQYPILNYILLASVIADKLEEQSLTLSDLTARIAASQASLVANSEGAIANEVLLIDKYQIDMPFVSNKSAYIFSRMLKCKKYLPHHTRSVFS